MSAAWTELERRPATSSPHDGGTSGVRSTRRVDGEKDISVADEVEDRKPPATRRESSGEAVTTEAARAAWTIAARETLEGVAGTYNATITYSQLAKEVQQLTDVVTTQLMRYWIGDVLGRVADECVEVGDPIVTAVCVKASGVVGEGYGAAVERATGASPADLQMHAAEERLRCYRHFGAELPPDGGRPTLTAQEKGRRERSLFSSGPPVRRAVCPTCFIQLPMTGVCDDCG
jgi:hypothetical protein